MQQKCSRFNAVSRFHLVYTERVGGSNPSPPTSLHCELRLGEADLAINAALVRLRARQPSLTQTSAARRRIDFSTRLCWLLDRRKSGALTGRAFDFRPYYFTFFQIYFSGMRKTICMSLCSTDCWSRLSHLRVTPDQFFSVTVP